MELTSSQKGGVAELKIAAAAADLGIDVGARLLRVQCKWAALKDELVVVRMRTSRHTPSRGYITTTYSASEIDGVAAYCRDLNRCFYLPIEEFEHRAFAYLRTAPTRNGQRVGVKMACDYPLGAVAQLGERVTGSHEVRGSSPLSSTFEPTTASARTIRA